MVDLLQMMVKGQLDAVVSHLGNGVIAMNEYIYSPAIDNIIITSSKNGRGWLHRI